METGKIVQLLSQTKNIVEKYDRIAEATGERFNIFEITGLETDEVKLHSAFIAELLNPKGSHGLKDRFLKLFLEMLSMQKKAFVNQEMHSEQKLYDNLDNARVSVEKYIGPLEENGYTGGRIDILIEFKNRQKIAIENKIYAIDQKHQLRRYANYAEDINLIDLIYLTLDGKEADINSTCNGINGLKDINPYCISYKTYIVSWLEKCLKESASRPLVRETITQYIYVIKKLTDQNNNDTMNTEIVNTIINHNFIVEAETIYNAWDEIKARIVENLIEGLKKECANSDWEINVERDNKPIGNAGTGFKFSKIEWDYCIYFYFENGDNLWFGIDHKNSDNITEERQNEIREKLKDFPTPGTRSTSDGWIWGAKFTEYNELEWSDVNTEAPQLIKRVLSEIARTIE
jgi:hypothetical protein